MAKNTVIPWNGNIEDIKNEADIELEIPIFIIFAEYLGYKSRFIKLAENWCDGKVPQLHVQKIMRMECLAIKRSMCKDYTRSEIRKWFREYYEPFFKELDEKLSRLINKD